MSRVAEGGRGGAKKCPMCGRAVVPRFRPFCSKRCADEDLGRWMSGTYRIATAERVANDDTDPDNETGGAGGGG